MGICRWMLASTTVHIHSNKSWMASGHPAYFTACFWENQHSTQVFVLKSSIWRPSLLLQTRHSSRQLQNIFHLCKWVNRIDLTTSVLECFLYSCHLFPSLNNVWLSLLSCDSSLYKHLQSQLGFCFAYESKSLLKPTFCCHLVIHLEFWTRSEKKTWSSNFFYSRNATWM
jgi:hypothetical protein